MGSKFHAVFFVSLYLFLVSGAVVTAACFTLSDQPTVDDWKNFGSAATVGLTAASAVMAAWLSIRNIAVQAKASESLERIKKVLDKRIPAHGDLFAAASSYYRELAPLESGQFDLGRIELAETRMKDAEGVLVYVGEEYSQAWMEFWQLARFMKEGVHKSLADPAERRQHWRENNSKLANSLSEMKRIAAKVFGA